MLNTYILPTYFMVSVCDTVCYNMVGFPPETKRILKGFQARGMNNTATKNNPALNKLIEDAMQQTSLSRPQVEVIRDRLIIYITELSMFWTGHLGFIINTD